MKISKSDLVLLFVAMGFKMAPKWAVGVLAAKLLKIQSLLDADTTVSDPKAAKLLKAIVKAQKAGETVEIGDSEEEAAEEVPAPKKGKGKKAVPEEEAPAPKKGKKAKPVEDEDEEEEEEEEEAPAPKKGKKAKPVEEDEEAPAPKKSKKAAKPSDDDEDEEEEDDEAPAPKKKPKSTPAAQPKVGVISAILTILGKATAKKPITKEQIVDKLVIMFPERERNAMRSTVNTQVPTRINATHEDVTIMRNEEGYYLEQ